jgi:DNA topoisomerase IB
MPRLRRSDLTMPGIARRRCGRGFSYRWWNGQKVADDDTLGRIRKLAVPPAWTDVWICPWPNGHIQAIGTDVAGRRQYRYHDMWRVHRDREKFDRALRFAQDLPRLRSTVARDLQQQGADRSRVLAAIVRLLDLGAFRIGGREYAETNETYGVVTLQKSHVRVKGNTITFDFPAKGSLERVFEARDSEVAPLVQLLKKRRGGDAQLFQYKVDRRWRPVSTDDVNDFIKEECGPDYSAKDFRNWTATVLAASLFAGRPAPVSLRRQRRAVADVVAEVAIHLGNTPAVCRSSYIDPRVIDRFSTGSTLRPKLAARMTKGSKAMTDAFARQAVESAVVALIGVEERVQRAA